MSEASTLSTSTSTSSSSSYRFKQKSFVTHGMQQSMQSSYHCGRMKVEKEEVEDVVASQSKERDPHSRNIDAKDAYHAVVFVGAGRRCDKVWLNFDALANFFSLRQMFDSLFRIWPNLEPIFVVVNGQLLHK